MSEARHQPARYGHQPGHRYSHINLGVIDYAKSSQTSEPREEWDVPPAPVEVHAAGSAGSTPEKGEQPQHQGTSGPQNVTGQASESSTLSQSIWPVHPSSPWAVYEKGYELKFDQLVTVAARKAPGSGLVAIRTITGQDAREKLQTLQLVCNKRIVSLLEIFVFERTGFAIFEHTPTSLKQVANSAAYPTEQHLVAILAQVSSKPLMEIHSVVDQIDCGRFTVFALNRTAA